MKMNQFFAVASFAALMFVSTANAAQVDISGDGNMGVVPSGQFGNIATDPVAISPTMTVYDSTHGYILPGSSILFTYTSSTVPLSSLGSAFVVGTGQYVGAGTQFQISSVNGSNTALGGSAPFQQAVNPATLPVILTSNLTPGSKTATATITNLSNAAVNFTSYFMSSINGLTNLSATYNISAVPLPASAALFLFGMAGLAGFGMYKKRRSKI